MRRPLFASFFLTVLLSRALGAQEPADSAPKSDTVSATRQSMAARDIESPPLWIGARFSDMLTARAAGLRVAPARGAIGSTGRFRIRGPQTIVDDRMPLVILDGMRLSAASGMLGGAARLEDLNPEEIESIEVIPGAASTALYGPGAANGVIVVRTREGREGRPRWDLYSEAGARRPYDGWPAWFGGIDADNPTTTYRTGGCALPAVALGSCVQDSIYRYNPYAYSGQLRSAVAQQHGLAVRGGLPWLGYFVSGELDGDGGLYALSSGEVERLTALGQPPRNATRHPEREGGTHLRANVRLRPANALQVSLRAARITNDLRVPPADPALWFDPFVGDWFQLETRQALNRRLGGADVAWRPLRGLSLRGAIGYDRVRGNVESLQRWGEGPRPPTLQSLGSVRETRTAIDTRTAGVSATYEFGSPERVAFRTLVGYEHGRFRRDSSDLAALLDSGETVVDTTTLLLGSWVGRWGTADALYAQQQIAFRDRFDVTLGLRRDRFKHYRKAAVHPSVSVSWLARSGGTGGGPLGSIRAHAAYGSAGRGANALERERTRELTAGVAGTLFAERVQVGVTLYDMRSKVLQFVGIPSFNGIVYGYGPGAEITNRGIELAVAGRLVERPDAALELTLVAWGNRNRLAKLPGVPVLSLGGGYRPGYPAGGYWAREDAGYSDANGDGIIAMSEVAGVSGPGAWAGTPNPTQGAALTGDLTLRGAVRFGATLDYQAGHTMLNYAAWSACSRWQCRALVDPGTPLAQQASALAAQGWPTRRFFEDADFLKLREVWLSVDVPRGIAAALRARSATLAIVGRNLHTWTGYSGIDPEPAAAEPVFGQPEAIADRLVMPRLPEWSVRVRLSY